MRRVVNALFTRRVLWFGILLLVCAPFSAPQAAPFLGDGKEYLTYVNGTMWLFAMEDNTQVTVRRVSNNQVLWQTTLTTAGTMQTRNFSADHVRVIATKRVTVGVGRVGGSDAYGTFLVSEKGTRVGTSFEGFTRSEVFVYCYLGNNATPKPSVTVTDVTDKGGSNDDTVTLTETNATFKNTDVMIWHRNNFDSDQIRVKSNRECTVMVGHRIRTSPRIDWALHVPSVEQGDGGRALGKRFYTFVHRTMMIVPTQNNTKITIKDLTDNDDSRTLTLQANQFFTARAYQATYRGYTQVRPASGGEFDNDFVEVVADKPVVVYVGPTDSDVNEYASHPSPLPLGNGKQRFFCYVQNGGASDFQIMVPNNKTNVTITTMAGRRNDSTTLTTLGSGGLSWSGPSSGPNWWESAAFLTEFVRVDTSQPAMVLCGDFDNNSWQSFLPFEVPNRAPVVTVNGGLTKTVKEDQTLTFTFTGTDPDNDTPLTWSFAGVPTGAQATANGANGSFTWKPTLTQAGTYKLTINLKDNGVPARTTSVVVTITVEDVNQPPTFTSTPPANATEDQPYSYPAKATDPNGGTLTYSLVTSPPGAIVNPSTGLVSWTPGDADVTAGTRTFTLRVCDNGTPPLCANQTWTVSVANVNDPPRFTNQPSTKGTEKQLYTYKPTVADPDPNETLTFKLNSSSSGVTVDTKTGELNWTPNAAEAAAGSRAFVLQVCDSKNLCALQIWRVYITGVNDPPRFTSTPPTNARDSQLYSYKPVATDPDPGDTLSYKLKQGPPGTTVDPQTGEVRWTPKSGDIGKSFSFEIEVCDQANACATQKWTVTVTGPNRPPTITSTPPTTASVGVAYTYSPTVTSPTPGVTFTWKLLQGPQGMTAEPTTGNVTWTPGAGDAGKTVSVSIQVCDNTNACATQTYTIQVGAQTCGVDSDCTANNICEGGRCVPPGCYQQACAAGELCVKGTCQKNTCLTKLCAPNTVCRPSDGQCVPLCPNVCPSGQECVNGTCQGDPCFNIKCAAGERCDGGSCVKDPCATAGSNACRYKRQCTKGACRDDSCQGVSCPSGGTCKSGQCYNPAPQEPNVEVTPEPTVELPPTEPPADQPSEQVGEQPQPDTGTEPPSDGGTEPQPDSGEPTVEPPPSDGGESVSPDTSEPPVPDTGEPVAPDNGEAVSPDTSEPVAPDTSEPSRPDTSEPGNEAVSPDTSETVTESTPEAISNDRAEASTEASTEATPDTSGESVAEEDSKESGTSQDDPGGSGAIGGGCRCSSQGFDPLSGLLSLLLLCMGLVLSLRRR
ncbi:MAG: hypothetical protein EP343_24045 [Deltaproteobacteria bacterium]|nr:MAG: hypothetical protein EP343_24045 [Deltaproteobacteria bacterium]